MGYSRKCWALGVSFLALTGTASGFPHDTPAEQRVFSTSTLSKSESDDMAGREWKWDAKPDPDETGNYIFHSLHSLVQHWPHTRYRNGALVKFSLCSLYLSTVFLTSK